MVERANKPSALAATPGLPPQPQVSVSADKDGRVTATLPSGESVTVLLFGATVLSWKDASGDEKLWLSDAAKTDGSKAVRGGIPIVFPVFGPPPADHPATSKLTQHGFARNSRWDFLGKSTSEAGGVKLDFGLSSDTVDPAALTSGSWPYKFGLLYSVTLSTDNLNTTLVVTNEGDEPFDCQVLLHTYLRTSDIDSVKLTGLEEASYIDKVDGAATKTESASDPVTITGETDRVYTPAKGPAHPIIVSEAGKPRFSVVRDNLEDVVVWNPWTDKAAGMGDFEPKDGWKKMVCVEAGSVKGWQKLDKGDVFEGAQTIYLLP